MTREEIVAFQDDLNRFRGTPVGAAFLKFKNAVISAWVNDTEDSFNDKNRASTKRMHDAANTAEKELKAEIYKLLGWAP